MLFLALIYLAFISLGLPDSLLGSSWPLMNVGLGVPVGHAGYISAIISGCTIVSSLFSHRLIGRFGTGKVTVVSVGLTAVALLGFSLTPSFGWLLAFAIPLGLGAGAVDSGLNGFMANHYSIIKMNLLHSFWGVGAMLGPILVSALAKAGNGWRGAYFYISIVQFVLVGLLLFSLPMWRKIEGVTPFMNDAGHTGENKQSMFAPLHTRGGAIAVLTFFIYAAVESSAMLWGASYLVKARGIPAQTAAGWISLLFIGMTAGRALGGFVGVKWGNESLIRLGIALMVTGIILLALPLPAVFMMCALFLIGLGMGPIFPSMLHQTPIYFDTQCAQAAMGMQIAAAYTGTTLMPPLFGQLFANVSFSIMPYVFLLCCMGLFACTARLSRIGKTAAE